MVTALSGTSGNHRPAMPTLMRFLTVLVVLAALAGAAIVYLATMVEPNTREMTIRIPPSKLVPQQP
jgi:hypothetical protein